MPALSARTSVEKGCRPLALFLLLLLLSAGITSAATWYVDGSNPSCTNSGPSAGLPASPYCTISQASNAT